MTQVEEISSWEAEMQYRKSLLRETSEINIVGSIVKKVGLEERKVTLWCSPKFSQSC